MRRAPLSKRCRASVGGHTSRPASSRGDFCMQRSRRQPCDGRDRVQNVSKLRGGFLGLQEDGQSGLCSSRLRLAGAQCVAFGPMAMSPRERCGRWRVAYDMTLARRTATCQNTGVRRPCRGPEQSETCRRTTKVCAGPRRNSLTLGERSDDAHFVAITRTVFGPYSAYAAATCSAPVLPTNPRPSQIPNIEPT